jgi:hypothetical protein
MCLQPLVADLLAVPKTRVWSMSCRDEIPTGRIGRREVRDRAEDIDARIARRRTSRPRGTSPEGERRAAG